MANDKVSPLPPILVLGNGLIGGEARRALQKRGRLVVSLSREVFTTPNMFNCDLSVERGRSALRALIQVQKPCCVVLAHGPSDVTWIESHQELASEIHVETAAVVAEVGIPALLISSDAVFSGCRGRHRTTDGVRPASAYGQIKAKAEEVLCRSRYASVLRVSLVYGWSRPRDRINFGALCLREAGERHALRAPTDQIIAPVYVQDVGRVIASLCDSSWLSGRVHHLAGPHELSRYEFARIAYELAASALNGNLIDPRLVEPCLRRETTWASRPEISSLELSDLCSVPGLEGWSPMTPEAGLRHMLEQSQRGLP